MSKRIMHLSVAALCLALAYHFGAKSVDAQVSGQIDGAHIYSPNGPNGTILVSGVVDRTFFWNGQAVGPPVPGTGRVIATHGGDGFYLVVLDNGDMYRATTGNWSFGGNLLGSPTPAEGITLGQLRVRYR